MLPVILRAIFFFLLIFFIIWPLYAAFRFYRPPRMRVNFVTPTSLGVAYEDVRLTCGDGVVLEGWYIPSRNGAAIMLLHGLGSNRLMMMQIAESLIKAGYGVLLFDLRAHGNSESKKFARSQQEVEDVVTAVAYLTKRKEVHAAGIGVFGISIGGLFALQAAAQTVAIRAVVADGASPAVFGEIPRPKSLIRWGFWAQQGMFMKMTDLFTNKPALPANQEIIPQISPRPMLFVAAGQGGESKLVRTYFEAAAEPKFWWQIPEARHAEGWLARPGEYQRRLLAFFDTSLFTKNPRRILLPDEPEAG